MSGTESFPQVWAHRGASATQPENTVAAFREALRQGADGVELDVRLSADGALVVRHDPRLPDGRAVRDLTVGELPSEVPLLGEALDACTGAVVNIEIKADPGAPPDDHERLAGAVVATVAEHGVGDRVVVSSFRHPSVERVRVLDPTLATALLVPAGVDPFEVLGRAVGAGVAAIHPYDLVVGAALVEAAHGSGLAVRVWTVDDPDRVRWHASLGVDAVMTNTPDVAIAALRRR